MLMSWVFVLFYFVAYVVAEKDKRQQNGNILQRMMDHINKAPPPDRLEPGLWILWVVGTGCWMLWRCSPLVGLSFLGFFHFRCRCSARRPPQGRQLLLHWIFPCPLLHFFIALQWCSLNPPASQHQASWWGGGGGDNWRPHVRPEWRRIWWSFLKTHSPKTACHCFCLQALFTG